jgi:hypothetical protein
MNRCIEGLRLSNALFYHFLAAPATAPATAPPTASAPAAAAPFGCPAGPAPGAPPIRGVKSQLGDCGGGISIVYGILPQTSLSAIVPEITTQSVSVLFKRWHLQCAFNAASAAKQTAMFVPQDCHLSITASQ